MTTYIRIEPQPRKVTLEIDGYDGWEFVPGGTLRIRFRDDELSNRLLSSIAIAFGPAKPGSQLDGKRVLSVGVVQREDGWFWEITTEGK